MPAGKAVESNTLVNNDDTAKKLENASEDMKVFAKNVIKANLDLVRGYKEGGKNE